MRITKPISASGDANDYSVVLYAMSVEDARRAAHAHAYVCFIDEQCDKRITDPRQKLWDTSQQAAADQKKLAQLGEPPGEAQKPQESLPQAVPYQGGGERGRSPYFNHPGLVPYSEPTLGRLRRRRVL